MADKDELDGLEFSTRTTNVLRMAGFTTRERIMKLTQNEVRALPNAGRKTWAEIAEWIGYVTAPKHTLADLVATVRRANEIRRYLLGDQFERQVSFAIREGQIEIWMHIE